ncbi:hypothetical protein NE237_029173 [Protea cynaroides]|uniref:IST1-like protein n=1 Tax=Protea cynaroides TaxID=273540 RepID=A0A9Q0GQP3_9MAGN|nr:hypothetical protein NE237_029173 [Protea cynaroides]
MLDGLLGRGFTSKCKSSIKLIKARIDVIRRKRNAMQKFLKKDVADLLRNGLDINAYGRAEGLHVELNLSSCYDLVEQFCLCILKQISVMQKQRECPEECREAVPSLMFAAARFADLPELRDLRQSFAERYGNSLESFVNQEFAEKMAAKPPTKEKKLQLMRDIAKEFSIKWDSKAFEQKMSNPPAYVQDQSKKEGSFHDRNDGYKLHKMEDIPEIDTQDVSSRGRELTHDGYKSRSHREDTVPKKDNQAILSNGKRGVHNSSGDTTLKRDNQDVPSRGRQELTDDGYKMRNEREDTISKREFTHDGYKSRSHREDTDLKKDNQAILSNGRQECSDDRRKAHNSRGDTTLKRDNQDIPSRGRLELTDDGYKMRNEREDTISKREFTHDEYKSRSHREDTVLKKDNQAILSNGRQECSDDRRKAHNSRGDTTLKRDNQDIPSRGRQELTDDGYKMRNEREDTISKREFTHDEYKSRSHREDTVLKKDNRAILSNGRQECSDDGRKAHNSRGDTTLKRDNQDISSRGRLELTDDGYKLRNGREDTISKKDNHDVSSLGWWEISSDKHKPHGNRDDNLLRREHRDLSSRGRQEVSDAGYKPKRYNLDGLSNGGWEHVKDAQKQCNGGEDAALESYNGDVFTHDRVGVTPSFTRRRQVRTDGIDVPVAVAGHNQYSPKNHSQTNKIDEENTESLKPFCNNIVPPPYIKPRGTKHGSNSDAQRSSSEDNEVSSDPPYGNRDVMRKKSEWRENRLDHVDYSGQLVGPARVNGYGDERDHLDDLVGDAKPRPRSVRRRQLRPPPGHDSVSNSEHEEAAKRYPTARKEDARRGLQTLSDDDFDSKYEEEKMMDKLLLHYSKKKPSAYEHSKMRKGSKAPPSHDSAADAGRPPRHRSRDEAHLNTGLGHPPARAVSLPPEPTTPTEVSRGPARARSFQPDGQVGHVHPKLPDCDDLAARIAALRRA